MSWTLSVPFYQRSQISRSPFCSVASSGGSPSRSVVLLAPAGLAFSLFTAWPAKMRRSLRTCEGVKAFPVRSVTPSRSSLWRAVTMSPLLQSRVWQIFNLALQTSQYVWRSGRSRPYLRKRVSRHSWAPSSVPFTVDGCTVSQAPVFVARCSRHVLWTEAPASVATSASSAHFWLGRRTAVRPSRRQAEWSAVRNSTCPLSAVKRCPVMTQDAVHFSGAVWVGSGILHLLVTTLIKLLSS